jgi:ornithine cyclodeaminase/alanine dehydrogenase-like protein (mu-crystallin family)
MAAEGVLFIPYGDTIDLLSIEDAMRICEDVFAMHARGTVQWSSPPSFKLDAGAPWHNHWHVKAALLSDIPTTGVRMYNYYDDGVNNTVGQLECTRYIVLTDPFTGENLAIVEEHWSYAIRSTAAAILPLKWLGPKAPKVLGLVGIGTMGVNALRCLRTMYDFEEIVCTSRRKETREAFAEKWSSALGIPVIPLDTIEEVVRRSDIGIGGTTLGDIVAREDWVKPGATYVSLARREMDPAGWARFDKVVIDDWGVNMLTSEFSAMIEAGQFSREALHGEICDVVTGRVTGRESEDERILVHTTGLVSQDIAVCHHIYEQAKKTGRGIRLPASGTGGPSPEPS